MEIQLLDFNNNFFESVGHLTRVYPIMYLKTVKHEVAKGSDFISL